MKVILLDRNVNIDIDTYNITIQKKDSVSVEKCSLVHTTLFIPPIIIVMVIIMH